MISPAVHNGDQYIVESGVCPLQAGVELVLSARLCKVKKVSHLHLISHTRWNTSYQSTPPKQPSRHPSPTKSAASHDQTIYPDLSPSRRLGIAHRARPAQVRRGGAEEPGSRIRTAVPSLRALCVIFRMLVTLVGCRAEMRWSIGARRALPRLRLPVPRLGRRTGYCLRLVESHKKTKGLRWRNVQHRMTRITD